MTGYSKCIENYEEYWNFKPVAKEMCLLLKHSGCIVTGTGYPKKTKKCDAVTNAITKLLNYTGE